jgi:pimeloyl-ACP methyl ester carboxylesterase
VTTTAFTPAGIDDLGAGQPALLLIPGWCGDRDVYDPVTAHLAQHCRTLVTDLRGQGGLASVDADFDSAQQVDDLMALIETRGLEQVVPVALAHAGWFAVELRRRLGPTRVPGLVLVDWMPLGPPAGFADALAGLQAPHSWEAVRAALVARWTTDVDNESVLRYVDGMRRYGFEHWSRAGREIAAGFAQGSPLAVLERLGGCPTLHLYAQPADPSYLALQEEFARLHPWFHVRRLEARSHFPMLETPGAMGREIRDFTRSLECRRATSLQG